MARAPYYSVPHEPPAPSASHQNLYPEHAQSHPEPLEDVVGSDRQANHAQMRQCSVRGCTTMLPPEYPQKMCEACRGRHRIYATTKRRKRKMEKQAIGGQLGTVVWMPPNSDEGENGQPEAGPSALPVPARPPEDREQSAPEYPLAQATDWDNSAIDPSLFSQDHNSYEQSQHSTADNNTTYSQELAYPPDPPPDAFVHHQDGYFHDPNGHSFSQPPDPAAYSQNSNSYSQGPSPYTQHSELAGALQLPQHHTPNQSTQPVYHPPQLPPQFSNDPPLIDPHDFPEDPPSRSQTRAPAIPTGEISAKAISEVAAEIGGTSLPHRYCSVKGCKAVVPGDSFFKMCEPCRNRYRSYGTTKRAKWKREKEAAVAELQKIRDDDDERRATVGLPPLAEGEWSKPPPAHLIQAANSQTPPEIPFATAQGGIAPRMCTVSHCREVLPPEYPFLRCERHRIQNRHHSKLKRVRDKESKAAAFQDWSAAVNAQGSPPEEEHTSQSPFAEEEVLPEEEVRNYYDQVLPDSEGTGVPPAARGSRRTNHVCSIKACYNLLSPFNPWKMCDACRDRDRAVRRNKALRDSGYEVEPLPPKPRTPPPPEGQRKARKKGKKQTVAEREKAQAQSQVQAQINEGHVGQVSQIEAADVGGEQGSRSPMVFMNPLAPLSDHRGDSFGLGDEQNTTQTTSSHGTHTSTASVADPSNDPPRQKRVPQKRKTSGPKDPATAGSSTAATATNIPSASTSVTTPQNAPLTSTYSATTATATTAPIPATQQVQPHYPFPYYPMPPYMAHYPPGTRYPPPPPPYGTSPAVMNREGYAQTPAPVFQSPPYAGYSPYAYPWSPWGPTPHFPAPIAMATTATATATPQVAQSTQAAPQASASSAAGTTNSVSTVPASTSSATSTIATSNQPSQDRAAMYSMFSSRPPGESSKSRSTQNNTTSSFQAGAVVPPGPPDPLKVTFSVRPGAGSSSPSKRKRAAEQESANKRQVTEGSNQNGYGNAGGARLQHVPGLPGFSASQFGVAAPAPAHTPAHPVATNINGVEGSQAATSSAPASDGKRLTCSNKSCNRALPSGTETTGLCERCKKQIKKKKDIVRRRAKLEPRNLVGSTATGGRLEVHGLH